MVDKGWKDGEVLVCLFMIWSFINLLKFRVLYFVFVLMFEKIEVMIKWLEIFEILI